MSRCCKCGKSSDCISMLPVCPTCMDLVGVSQSRSSGGSSAAGTGQRAHSSDGCNLSSKDLTLKKVTSFDGEGWYYNAIKGLSPICLYVSSKDEWNFNDGEWWKICESLNLMEVGYEL